MEIPVKTQLQYAARRLRRGIRPALFSVLALCIGIGLNGALYTIIAAAFLRPLPFERADRLFFLSETNPSAGIGDVSVRPANFVDWQQQTRTFRELDAFTLWGPVMRDGERAQQLTGASITPNLLPLLGGHVQLGRSFRDEDRDGEVVLLGHALWVSRFAADPAVIGRTFAIDKRLCTVVGVMAPDFEFPYPFLGERPAIWTLRKLTSRDVLNRRGHELVVVGRLKDRVSLTEARAEFETIAANLERAYSATNKGWRVRIVSFRDELTAPVRRPILVLSLASLFVLLLACANVGCLMVAQGLDQTKEMATRLALGARPTHLIGQVLADSLLISAIGLGAGLFVASCATALARSSMFPFLPMRGLERASLDWSAFLFLSGLALVITVLTGALPAWVVARTALISSLEGASPHQSRSRFGVRMLRSLVVVQIALATTLVCGTGVLIAAVVKFQRPPLDYDAERTLAVTVLLPIPQYLDPALRRSFFPELAERFTRVPGAVTAGGVSRLSNRTGISVQVEPSPPRGASDIARRANLNIITPSYFQTINARLIQGRLLQAGDMETSTRTVVVNESLARAYWGKESPVGRQLRVIPVSREVCTVVGVIKDVYNVVEAGRPELELYATSAYLPVQRMTMLLRFVNDATTHLSEVARVIKDLEPLANATETESIDQVLQRSARQPRTQMLLILAFSMAALVLAGLGVYGVVSYMILARKKELAIRSALGASPGLLIRRVVLDGFKLGVVGALAGTLGASALKRAIMAQFETIEIGWLGIWSFAVAFVMVTCLVATYWPARTINDLDPAAVLRQE